MRRILTAIAMLLSLAAPALAQPQPDTVLILDASGSMWGVVDGRTKIEAARGAVGTILSTWRPGARLGLMAYGHRSKGECSDIEMVVPIAAVDPATIRGVVDGLVPKGKTPITEALNEAAAALKSNEGRSNVILVSDGIETCGGDPCAAAAALKKAGVGFTAHVIGFDVADPIAKAQLQCIAQATGGIYLDARNAGGLETALGRAVEATRGVKVASEAPARPATKDPLAGFNLRATARLAEDLDPVTDSGLIWELHRVDANGAAGEWVRSEYGARLAVTHEPGDYVLRVKLGSVSRDFPVSLPPGQIATFDVVLDAGYVTSEGAILGSGQQAQQVAWEVRAGDTWIVTSYDAVPEFVLPAGAYTLKLTKGNASARKDFALAAGDSINLALGLDAGKLIVDAVYARPGPKVTTGLTVEVRRPPTQEGEQGEWVATLYDALSSFDLPSGSYDLAVTVGKAVNRQRIAVASGAPTRLTVDLGAGVIGLTAPGAESVEIFGLEKDINGEVERIDTLYGEKHNVTLNAGSYLAVATRGGEKIEQPITVVAGKRTEITIGR